MPIFNAVTIPRGQRGMTTSAATMRRREADAPGLKEDDMGTMTKTRNAATPRRKGLVSQRIKVFCMVQREA
jgi:hypothetical protein